MTSESEKRLSEVELFWEFYHMTVRNSSNLDYWTEDYVPATRIYETPHGSVDELLAVVNHRIISATDPDAELTALAEDFEALCDSLNLFRTDFARLKHSSYQYEVDGGSREPSPNERYIFAPEMALDPLPLVY
jgi:hypothetical protein